MALFLKSVVKVLDGSGNPKIVSSTTGFYGVLVERSNGVTTDYFYVSSNSEGVLLNSAAQVSTTTYATANDVPTPGGWVVNIPVSNCSLTLSFADPVATNIAGNKTRFLITVNGNSDKQVEFEYGNGWIAGDNLNSKTFEINNYVNAPNNPVFVNVRIVGCTNSIQGRVFTFESTITTTPPTAQSEITYVLSPTDNYLNLEQFDDVVIPEQLQFGTGAGFPQFLEQDLGLIAALRKGYAYTNNGSAYGESRIPSSRASVFKTPDGEGGRLEQIALQVSNVGGIYESAKYIHANNGHQFHLVTDVAANAVGRNYSPATSFKPNNQNCVSNWYSYIGYLFFDSEIYSDSADWHRVMWNIIQGIKESSIALKNVFFYGRYATSFLQGGELSNYKIGAMNFDATYLNNWNNNGNYYRWTNFTHLMQNTCIDLGQYFREVLPVSASLYKKDGGGNYILVSGKRVYRDDTFTEAIFGFNNEYLAIPHDEVRYRQKSSINGSEQVNSVLQPNHYWTRGESVYRNPAEYKTSIEWALEAIFRVHDLMQDGLRSVTKNQFGTLDITTYRPWLNTKPGATFCVYTEPFTYGGNNWKRNWVTPEMLKWMYLDAAFSGIFNIEMWQDGTGGEFGLTNNVCPEPTTIDSNNNPTSFSTHIIKAQGQELYPAFNQYYFFNNNRWNSIEVVTATVNKIVKLFQGVSFNNTLRFGSFSKAIVSGGNKEILGKFFYQQSKLVMYLYNPFNDPQDITSIVIRIGTFIETISLQGRNVKLLEYNIQSYNVTSPQDVKLEYNNIDGTLIKVTGNINNHTWS